LTVLPLAITGLGLARPERLVTNTDLEAVLDTNDEWIRSRSGIGARRWAGASETTASLAAEAVAEALKDAGRTPDDVGLLVLATCTPDQVMPHTGAAVCDSLGLRCGSFDLHAACAGFVDGLLVAGGLVPTAPGVVVVVGVERLTSILDLADRTTAVLFADGAGAAVVEPAGDGGGALLGWDAGTDGSLSGILEVPAGERFIRMDGGEVFRRAVRVVVDSAVAACDRAGVVPGDIDVFVPHQANVRIIEAACSRLGIPLERTVVNLERWGNTSAASVPVALAEASAAGRLATGDHVLLSGFGAGMTWASALLRWA
jgi:3-oxoacyl-[acyl-carrier-protein] synthase-3